MRLNLKKWYLSHYKNFDDNVEEMAIYLSKAFKVDEKQMLKELKKVRYDRLKYVMSKQKMQRLLYRPFSKWSKYLLKEMFKWW